MSNEAWRAGWASRRRFIAGAAAGAAWAGLGGFARAGGRKAFADDLDYLRRKWREPCADPSTGLETAGFRDALERLAAELKGREPWEIVKARLFALGCGKTAIDVDPHDWYPAFASYHRHRDFPMSGVLSAREAEVDARYAPTLPARTAAGAAAGRWAIWKDFDHCCPDWDAALALGFPGLKARLVSFRRDTDYYRAREIAADAVLGLLDRLVAQGRRRLAADGPSARLEKEVAALANLRRNPPRTAYEALLFIYLTWVAGELFDGYQVRTLGNLDRLLAPYYRADLAAGRTTEAEFREQLRHFWWQWGSIDNYWGQPVYLGGTKADGTSEYNEVSRIILDVHDELALPTPKMHLKIAKSTPEWVWAKTLDMMRRQRSLSFCGEEPIARVMRSVGCTDEEARACIIWGCYEWGVRDSANTSGPCYVNLLKCVEETLGAAEDAPSFADFRRRCLDRISATLGEALGILVEAEAHLAEINPSNLFSLTVEHSVRNGADAHGGRIAPDGGRVNGTRHGNNTHVLLVGLGTTVDALLAVKEIVYERRTLTLAALAALMAADWAGNEPLRLRMMRSKRKWGNNDPEANALGREIVRTCAAAVNGRPNARGGRFYASGHSARQHIELGRRTGATPDGRKAGEEMSKNVSPTMGADTEGATALVETAAALDARDLPHDFPLDVALLPHTVAGEKGALAMRALVETYFANGGMVIQFNVQDAETLRDAQRHPEKYENLQVRVCGWNVRWNDIPKVEQDKFILRQETIR